MYVTVDFICIGWFKLWATRRKRELILMCQMLLGFFFCKTSWLTLFFLEEKLTSNALCNVTASWNLIICLFLYLSMCKVLFLIELYIRWNSSLYNMYREEKKEEIWLNPMTKNPYTHRKIKKATRQHNNAIKNFDYTTNADRLRTVRGSNNSHPTGVVKPVYERSTFPLTATTE